MGDIFGKGQKTIQMPSTKIDAGGLIGKGARIRSSPERQGLVGQISRTFPQQADFLSQLRASVAPGASALRESRLAALAGNRRRAIGDLRENLGRRRVMGSSFAQDALTRTNLEFQREQDRIEAESFMTELELSHQLAMQEFEARRGEFQTFLEDMNFQAELGANLAAGVQQQMGANARLQAQLNANASAGAGSFFGKLAGVALAPFTGGASLALTAVA